MTSIVPDIRGAHASGESVEIESVARRWRLLKVVSQALAAAWYAAPPFGAIDSNTRVRLNGSRFPRVERMLTMQIPNRDGDGYLIDMNDWTPEIGRLLAEADGYELNEKKWEQIIKTREYYEELG